MTSENNLKPWIAKQFADKGMDKLTPIQSSVFNQIEAGESLIVESPTGTGKTLAYLLPIFQRMEENAETVHPQVLIIGPTRELVMQIVEVIRTWTSGTKLKVTALIGGTNVKRQVDALKKHPQFVVGTADRVIELIHSKKLKLHNLKTVVFDEVDEMVRQKQGDRLETIVKSAMKETQMLFVSATIVPKTTELIHKWKDNVGHNKAKAAPELVSNINYYYLIVDWKERKDVLRRLSNHLEGKSLAFANDRFLLTTINQVVDDNSKMSVIYSETNKLSRVKRIKNFRENKIDLLLSSDLISRGMDFEGLKNIVHVDLPETEQQWKHRNGRVGRMGAAGNIYFLITEQDIPKLNRYAKKFNVEELKEVTLTGTKILTQK